jgi:hypothetical protein
MCKWTIFVLFALLPHVSFSGGSKFYRHWYFPRSKELLFIF